MKMSGMAVALTAGAIVGMAAGACLVMNNSGARKVYRYGKRYAKHLLKM